MLTSSLLKYFFSYDGQGFYSTMKKTKELFKFLIMELMVLLIYNSLTYCLQNSLPQVLKEIKILVS